MEPRWKLVSRLVDFVRPRSWPDPCCPPCTCNKQFKFWESMRQRKQFLPEMPVFLGNPYWQKRCLVTTSHDFPHPSRQHLMEELKRYEAVRSKLTGPGGSDSLRGKGKKVWMLNLGRLTDGLSRLGFTASLDRFCWILSISQSSSPICISWSQ